MELLRGYTGIPDLVSDGQKYAHSIILTVHSHDPETRGSAKFTRGLDQSTCVDEMEGTYRGGMGMASGGLSVMKVREISRVDMRGLAYVVLWNLIALYPAQSGNSVGFALWVRKGELFWPPLRETSVLSLWLAGGVGGGRASVAPIIGEDSAGGGRDLERIRELGGWYNHRPANPVFIIF